MPMLPPAPSEVTGADGGGVPVAQYHPISGAKEASR
jgi:hypothetical protein